ncbi:MAG: hypothetical protein HW387_714 [Parachlamydiales bacterium]|nr:hypothetical protein [Parachlamydiales bacterium]
MSSRIESQNAVQEVPGNQNQSRFVDWTTIRHGFHIGIGTTIGGALVIGTVGATKAAWK